MKPVWMNRAKSDPDPLVLAFCAGRDVQAVPPADAELVPWDLWTNRAHVVMLRDVGILSRRQAALILRSLRRLETLHQRGQWSLDPALEDVHANVETWVSQDVGSDLGGTIHTGRSRNDQVATDVRLWLRDAALAMTRALAALLQALGRAAAAHTHTVLPGLTHHQPGSVTTLAHWHLCHAEAFARDTERLRNAYGLINRCPLGATASFGTSWPVDRRRTAQLLGFAQVQRNSLDCVASRWELEAELGQALVTMMTHASMLAQDLILYTTEPFGFVTLDERHTTGSSVMPQKRNPDPCEVIKAKAAVAQQLLQALRAIPTGNATGYNRDSQWTKYLILDLWREVQHTPQVLALLVSGARWDVARMRAACERGFLSALDVAERLAQDLGVSFRQAYRVVSTAVTRLRGQGEERLTAAALNAALADEGMAVRMDEETLRAAQDPLAAVCARKSLGSPHPNECRAMQRAVQRAAQRAAAWANRERKRLETCRRACR